MSFVFFIVLLPIGAMFLTMNGANVSQAMSDIKNLSLDLSFYDGSQALVARQANKDELASAFESMVTASGSTFQEIPQDQNISQALLQSADEDLLNYRSKMIVALDSRNVINGLFSTLAYHSAPIVHSMLSNAFIRQANLTAQISTSNFPYELSEENCSGNSLVAIQLIILFITPYGFAMLIVVSYFVIFPHTERITSFKHLQIMTGAQPALYWITTLIADVTLYIIPVALSLIVVLLTDNYNMFSSCVVLGGLTLVLVLFGLGCITLAYLCSYLFKTYTSAMELCIFVSVGAELRDNATIRSFEINTELIYLAAAPFFYLFLILMIDHGIFRMIIAKLQLFLYGKIQTGSELTDLDVAGEKEIVDASRTRRLQDPSESQPIFVCDDLGKKFSRSLTAVHDVTFAISRSECFGLLGVNGAGKSTTFGMLTGSLIPTKGDARILKFGLGSHRQNYLKRLGYCPQLDGLLLEMSAKSLLSLFGRLRGIPSFELPGIVQKWIDALDMADICDRPCKGYSGGNKRKLSTAIALIGDPPVVLLDEPTTGVDPVVRRKIWSILKYCREMNGQTIIITSHSMDECEATCDRLTIMVKGYMKCIGTIPRLKNVYGHGYVLLVKLIFSCTEQESNDTLAQIERSFAPYIRLQDQQHGLFNFHIDSRGVKLHKVFQIMNTMVESQDKIEDFSISDISLEQVFLSLAKAN
ncbi:ATP-Hypothetical protein cassette sub-family A member [Nesidiocoris tenuis]|uniref:ABC transporter domain-containing protein n=1 Tax=Nesidiocoris tenuis TaxID=355587 RepID=A0ABN7ACY5_9HEMI|nr:ATP-Hypothetical protein cassette sub-family A member [Nesidiocoris tenuis]